MPHAMAMLIPEAWATNYAHEPAEAGLLRIPRVADGALGRSRRHRLHRRPRRSAPRSTATASAPRATWSPTTTWSIMASETGVLPVKPEDVEDEGPPAARQDAAGGYRRKGRIVADGSSKRACTAASPTSSGSRKTRSRSTSCPSRRASIGTRSRHHPVPPARVRLHRRRSAR